MAQVLCEVYNFGSQKPALVPVRLVQVDGDELVANFGGELAVVDLAVGRHVFEHFELVDALAELLLVVVLPVILLALVLGPLLPAILVEAV